MQIESWHKFLVFKGEKMHFYKFFAPFFFVSVMVFWRGDYGSLIEIFFIPTHF
jgi:hypothetical protein